MLKSQQAPLLKTGDVLPKSLHGRISYCSRLTVWSTGFQCDAGGYVVASSTADYYIVMGVIGFTFYLKRAEVDAILATEKEVVL